MLVPASVDRSVVTRKDVCVDTVRVLASVDSAVASRVVVLVTVVVLATVDVLATAADGEGVIDVSWIVMLDRSVTSLVDEDTEALAVVEFAVMDVLRETEVAEVAGTFSVDEAVELPNVEKSIDPVVVDMLSLAGETDATMVVDRTVSDVTMLVSVSVPVTGIVVVITKVEMIVVCVTSVSKTVVVLMNGEGAKTVVVMVVAGPQVPTGLSATSETVEEAPMASAEAVNEALVPVTEVTVDLVLFVCCQPRPRHRLWHEGEGGLHSGGEDGGHVGERREAGRRAVEGDAVGTSAIDAARDSRDGRGADALGHGPHLGMVP